MLSSNTGSNVFYSTYGSSGNPGVAQYHIEHLSGYFNAVTSLSRHLLKLTPNNNIAAAEGQNGILPLWAVTSEYTRRSNTTSVLRIYKFF
jgi:hypothetical protein